MCLLEIGAQRSFSWESENNKNLTALIRTGPHDSFSTYCCCCCCCSTSTAGLFYAPACSCCALIVPPAAVHPRYVNPSHGGISESAHSRFLMLSPVKPGLLHPRNTPQHSTLLFDCFSPLPAQPQHPAAA